MPHIAVPADLVGISGLMATKPAVGEDAYRDVGARLVQKGYQTSNARRRRGIAQQRRRSADVRAFREPVCCWPWAMARGSTDT